MNPRTNRTKKRKQAQRLRVRRYFDKLIEFNYAKYIMSLPYKEINEILIDKEFYRREFGVKLIRINDTDRQKTKKLFESVLLGLKQPPKINYDIEMAKEMKRHYLKSL